MEDTTQSNEETNEPEASEKLNPTVQESENEEQPANARCSWLKCSGKTKLTIGLVVLLVGLVGTGIALAVCKLSNKEEYEHQKAPELGALQRVYTLPKQVDEQIDPDGVCNPTRCDQLVLDIPGTRTWLEEFHCRSPNTPIATEIRCNGTYLSAEYLRQNINRHINCKDESATNYITCCTIVLVSNYMECGGAGNLVCRNDTSVPVCNCITGRKGTQCDQPHTEQVQCKCIASHEKFVGENTMANCSDMHRPEHWTKCFHYLNNGAKCTCFHLFPDALRMSPNAKANTAASVIASFLIMMAAFGIQSYYREA